MISIVSITTAHPTGSPRYYYYLAILDFHHLHDDLSNV